MSVYIRGEQPSEKLYSVRIMSEKVNVKSYWMRQASQQSAILDKVL